MISQASKYGIRAAVHLAHHPDKALLGREIAAELGMPAHFLAKILQTLSRRGILLSFKGRGGGFKLARPADKIVIFDIVQALEGPSYGENCFLGLKQCSEEAPCPLHYQWIGLKDQLLDMLRHQSLQQVIEETSKEIQ